jgi:hypothetical protein
MSAESDKIKALLRALMQAPLKKFPELRGSIDAPREQGVYAIYDSDEVVVHVGMTPRAAGGIRQRLSNHLTGSSSFKYYYLEGEGKRLRGKFSFRCLPVEGPRERALLECLAIGTLCPKHIGHGRPQD